MEISTPSKEDKAIYLKGLNGLRAIAASGVIIFHLNPHLDRFHLKDLPHSAIGHYAVTMFFALSGFLITFLLLKEINKTGTVDIPKFYLRRVLRIWPLYFFYLFLCFLFLSYVDLSEKSIFYLLFASNAFFYLGSPAPLLVHYWSLAVEEQFYLFWPSFFRNTKRLLLLLIIFIIALVCIKFFVRLYLGPKHRLFHLIFASRYQCMAIGGLAGYFYVYHRPKLLFINHWFFQLFAWTGVGLVCINKFDFFTIIDHELFAFITVMLIIQQISGKRNMVNLDNNILNYLGKISFGIYVYHPLIIHLLTYTLAPAEIPPVVKYPLVYLFVMVTTILIADLSYRYLEKPFLKIKNKYTIVKSSNSAVSG